MNRFPLSRIVLALSLCALAGAAAGAGPDRTRADAIEAAGRAASVIQLTSAEQQVRLDPIRFQQTVIGGMLVGAANRGVGDAARRALERGNGKQIREAFWKGALTGAGDGGIDGYIVATQEEAGRRHISAIQVAAANVQQDNERLQAFLEGSARVLAEGKHRLAALRADLHGGKISAAAAEQARQREEENISALRRSLDEARQTREQYQQAAAKFAATKQRTRDLDVEIERMNRQIGQLETNVSDYNRALAVSRA